MKRSHSEHFLDDTIQQERIGPNNVLHFAITECPVQRKLVTILAYSIVAICRHPTASPYVLIEPCPTFDVCELSCKLRAYRSRPGMGGNSRGIPFGGPHRTRPAPRRRDPRLQKITNRNLGQLLFLTTASSTELITDVKKMITVMYLASTADLSRRDHRVLPQTRH